MLRRALWVLGLSIMVSSIALIASGIYGLYLYYRGATSEEWASRVMLGYGILYLIVGRLLYWVGEGEIRRAKEALIITVLVWILIPFLEAIPFMAALGIPFIDALFESVSGWTTTGLTILSGQHSSWHGIYVPLVDEIPETLKMWRTLMQWEGGLGIVILTVAVLAPPGVSAAVLYLAEGKFEKLEASFKRTSVLMGFIYLILTLVSVLLFLVAGMTPMDALHHAMTGIATAGFSPHSQSLGYYLNRPAVLVAGMIVMMMGAISFSDHWNIMRGNFKALRDSIELQAQILILGFAMMFAYIVWAIVPSFHENYSLLQALFHVDSALATAGFQAGDLHNVPEAYKLIIAVLSIIGGSAFSTAGGIKVLRLVIAVKAISIEADTVIKPPGYVPKRRIGKYVVNEVIVRRSLATITAFVSTYIILSMILSALVPSYDLGDVLLEVASAMGNVGLSSGISAAAAPLASKVVLIAAMLLGRLEVVSYLIVLKAAFSR
ncbi:MAG: TrkH family potassium uptake protein [Desulfurococcales archaeon]|nr:TrkH family potassium uptake protein [Desulfurococcales archaeon]